MNPILSGYNASDYPVFSQILEGVCSLGSPFEISRHVSDVSSVSCPVSVGGGVALFSNSLCDIAISSAVVPLGSCRVIRFDLRRRVTLEVFDSVRIRLDRLSETVGTNAIDVSEVFETE